MLAIECVPPEVRGRGRWEEGWRGREGEGGVMNLLNIVLCHICSDSGRICIVQWGIYICSDNAYSGRI